jgi:hypothetical protein
MAFMIEARVRFEGPPGYEISSRSTYRELSREPHELGGVVKPTGAGLNVTRHEAYEVLTECQQGSRVDAPS